MADVSDLRVSAEQAARQARRLGMWARVVLVPVAVIGAVLSFRSLYQAAVPTFGDYLAAGFPLLVDLLILGASLQYVAGAKIGRPMAGWRLTAHAGVAGTLVLNALAAKELGEVPWHVTAPAVWAVLVELTAKQVLGEWKATHTAPADKISLPLWMTAPVESIRTRLLMFRTGITDAHKARIAVGVNAAAREALRLALPKRNARRVRKIINRQLRAGSLTPVAILRPLGWTKGGTVLNNARPDVILQAVLQEVLDPGAPPAPIARPETAPAVAQVPAQGQPVQPVPGRPGQPVPGQPVAQPGEALFLEPNPEYAIDPALVAQQQAYPAQPVQPAAAQYAAAAGQAGVGYPAGVAYAGVPQPGVGYPGGGHPGGVQQPAAYAAAPSNRGVTQPVATAQPGQPQFAQPQPLVEPVPGPVQPVRPQPTAYVGGTPPQGVAQPVRPQPTGVQPGAFAQPVTAETPVLTQPGGADWRPETVQQPDRALQLGRSMHRGRVLQETGSPDHSATTAELLRSELTRSQAPGQAPKFESPQFAEPEGPPTGSFAQPWNPGKTGWVDPSRSSVPPRVEQTMEDELRPERWTRPTEPFLAPTAIRGRGDSGQRDARGGLFDNEILDDMEHLDELDGQEYPDDVDGLGRGDYIDLDGVARQGQRVPRQ